MNQELFIRRVLQLAAVIMLAIALSLLILPGEVLRLFENDQSHHQQFAVYLGTALIGFSFTNWLYSRSQNLSAVLPAIYGNLVSLITATVIDVVLMVSGEFSKLINLILFLHLFFALAFGYCVLLLRRSNFKS